ncbi:piRNA biogenesis protein EXD1-like [Leptinotarsa decemlineata]|uniref:piRNA biogenesis protein EXD1-like n=1 Tax=Leptinotarsa decemlineata TaxID=7539 RepID=UPI003D30407D
MDVKVPYNEVFKHGDYLILTLYDHNTVEGNYLTGGKHRMELVNTKFLNHANELQGVCAFYRKEIKKIHKLKGSTDVDGAKEYKKIESTEEEYRQLKDMCTNYVYLDQQDRQYHEAIDKLSEAETIAVIAFGLENSQAATVKLFALCTWKRVYLFDTVLLRNWHVHQAMKNLFESPHTCKVMHHARQLVDVLHSNYNIFTRNVFDTRIADLLTEKNNNGVRSQGKTLPDCVVKYLKFPLCLFENSNTTEFNWDERPLHDSGKCYAAQLVAYLFVLKKQMSQVLSLEIYEAMKSLNK